MEYSSYGSCDNQEDDDYNEGEDDDDGSGHESPLRKKKGFSWDIFHFGE